MMEQWRNGVMKFSTLQYSNHACKTGSKTLEIEIRVCSVRGPARCSDFFDWGNLAGTCGAELPQRKHDQRARKCCAADPVRSHGPSSSCGGCARARKGIQAQNQLWQGDFDPENRCRRFDRA